jgi:hypothetical protein
MPDDRNSGLETKFGIEVVGSDGVLEVSSTTCLKPSGLARTIALSSTHLPMSGGKDRLAASESFERDYHPLLNRFSISHFSFPICHRPKNSPHTV